MDTASSVHGKPGPEDRKASVPAVGILIVDDEEVIHTLGRRILEREGFTVHCALDRARALEILRGEGSSIRLALVDVLMPEIEGTDLARQLLTIQPELRLLFASGYGVTPDVSRFIEAGQADFLPKPFTRDDILRKIQHILN